MNNYFKYIYCLFFRKKKDNKKINTSETNKLKSNKVSSLEFYSHSINEQEHTLTNTYKINIGGKKSVESLSSLCSSNKNSTGNVRFFSCRSSCTSTSDKTSKLVNDSQFNFKKYNELNLSYNYTLYDNLQINILSITTQILNELIKNYNEKIKQIVINHGISISKRNCVKIKPFHYSIIDDISNYRYLTDANIKQLYCMEIEEKIFVCIHYKKCIDLC